MQPKLPKGTKLNPAFQERLGEKAGASARRAGYFRNRGSEAAGPRGHTYGRPNDFQGGLGDVDWGHGFVELPETYHTQARPPHVYIAEPEMPLTSLGDVSQFPQIRERGPAPRDIGREVSALFSEHTSPEAVTDIPGIHVVTHDNPYEDGLDHREDPLVVAADYWLIAGPKAN